MDAQLGTKRNRQQNQMFIWSVFIKEGEDWANISDNDCPCDTRTWCRRIKCLQASYSGKVLLLLICLFCLCCSGQW